jgi:hypothetical protein
VVSGQLYAPAGLAPVSEEYIASISMVEQQAKQETSKA